MLFAVVAASVASCGGKRRPPPADEDAAVGPALAPIQTHTPTGRTAAGFVIAVDQSTSMAGFAETGAIELVIEAVERALKQKGVDVGQVKFVSIGAQVESAKEQELWDRTRFRKGRADLVAALAAPDLAASDVSIIITDGQPTSARGVKAPCSPLGTEDVSGLAGTLTTFLDGGRGVWLIFERRPFRGTVFLNCSQPTQAIKDALAARSIRLSCGGECSHAHDGERVVLTVVVAGSAVVDEAAHFVDAYTAELRGAEALRLHASRADLWTVGAPEVELVGERGISAALVQGSGGEWISEIRCPTREAGVRICLRANEPSKHQAAPMTRLAPPVATLQPDQRGDLYLLPNGTGLDPATLRLVRAAEFDCTTAWSRYEELVGEASAAPPAGCPAADGVLTAEVAVACGCLHGGPHDEILEWSQSDDRANDAMRRFGERYGAHERSWYEEPDRINGLSALLGAIATRPVDQRALTIGRIRIQIGPPR